MHNGILRRLREMPRKMEKQQLVSPSRQCSSAPVTFGQGFLSKEQCDSTGAAPIPLAPSDFYLLHQTNSALQVRRFYDATNSLRM